MDIEKAIETLEGWSGVSKLGRVLILVYAAHEKGISEERVPSIVKILGLSGWELSESAVGQNALPTSQPLIEGLQKSFVTSQVIQQADGRFYIAFEGKRFVEQNFSDLPDFQAVVDALADQLKIFESWNDDQFWNALVEDLEEPTG